MSIEEALPDLRSACEPCGGIGRIGTTACAVCGGAGVRAVTAAELPDQDTWILLLAAELAEHGTWPETGGWLWQTVCCVEGVTFVWTEQARCEAEMRSRRHD